MKLSILFVLLGCVCGAFGQANSSFYVSTTGDDSNLGTQTAPWRTVQHAADTVRAGSTVNLRGGIYKELVTIKASGNATDGFITFRSYPGETAVLDADHFVPTVRSAVLTIHNKSYVRIEGLEIRNYRTAEHRLTPLGISVMGSGSHIDGIQSFSLGYLTTWNWHYWPDFLMPFALIGTLIAVKIWYDLPAATRKHLADVG